MQILRTLQTGGAGDGDLVLLDNWPRDVSAEGLYFDVDMPVNVGTAGTPTTTDLRNLLNFFLGEVSIKYGVHGQFKALIAITGSKLRNIHRFFTQREVFNDFVSVAQTTGNKTFRARLFYTPNRQKARGRRRLIGWTQGRTIEIETKEGAALTAGALNLTRNGSVPCVIRVVPAYRIGPNSFTHLPHYREINRDALDVKGPDGLTLAFWDDNAAFASTAIGKHSIDVGGKRLAELVEPKYVDEDYAREIDQGGADITDEVTLLHVADPFTEEENLPTGPVVLNLVNQDVTTIKGRFVFLPDVTDKDAAQVVSEAAMVAGEAIAGTLPPPPSDPAKNGYQAVAPLELIGRNDSRYSTEPSIRVEDDDAVRSFIPPALTRAAPPGFARKFQKLVSLRVPGQTMTGSGRGTRNGVREGIRGFFSSLF